MTQRSLARWLASGAVSALALACGGEPGRTPATSALTDAGAPSPLSPGVESPEGAAVSSPEVSSPAAGAEAPADERQSMPLGSGALSPRPSDTTPDAGAAGRDAGAAAPLRVFLAGDSIVQSYPDTASERDQAGWGQMLHERLGANVRVENHAIGGRTARRFIDEGRLDALAAELRAGDTLLVQFGTNDGNRTATYTLDGAAIPYFLDPATDFEVYLERYVEAARERGASPVLVTPTPRDSAYCTGGNGTGAHAAAMRELGQALAVPVVDLNARAVAHLQAICPAPTPEDFFLVRPDGSVDGTHFQENGARILAGFVADELASLGLPSAPAR